MKCVEPGCNEEAGTPWTPYWCKKHDKERRERISKSLEEISQKFKEKQHEQL